MLLILLNYPAALSSESVAHSYPRRQPVEEQLERPQQVRAEPTLGHVHDDHRAVRHLREHRTRDPPGRNRPVVAVRPRPARGAAPARGTRDMAGRAARRTKPTAPWRSIWRSPRQCRRRSHRPQSSPAGPRAGDCRARGLRPRACRPRFSSPDGRADEEGGVRSVRSQQRHHLGREARRRAREAVVDVGNAFASSPAVDKKRRVAVRTDAFDAPRAAPRAERRERRPEELEEVWRIEFSRWKRERGRGRDRGAARGRSADSCAV